MVVIGVLQLLAIVFFFVLLIVAVRSGELHRESVRTYWRMKPFAWTGFVGIPILAARDAARGALTGGEAVGLAVFWLCFAALLRWVSRPPARRGAAGGGRRRPS